MAAIGGRNM